MRFPRAPGASHSREWAAPTGCAKPLCQRFAQGGQAAPERIATDAVRPAHRAGRPAKVRPLREHGGQKPGVRTHHNESAAGRGLTGTVGLSLSADAARVTPKPSRTGEPESQRAREPEYRGAREPREPESQRAGEPAQGELQYDDHHVTHL